MKKRIFLFLATLLLLVSCGDDEITDDKVYKTITVEINRSSNYLYALEDNNTFTVDPETTQYNEKDWSMVLPNEGKILLINVNKNLSNSTSFSFLQEKVNFQLISVYYIKDSGIEEEDIGDFETTVTFNVDGKVVKTHSFPFRSARPNIFTYSEN